MCGNVLKWEKRPLRNDKKWVDKHGLPFSAVSRNQMDLERRIVRCLRKPQRGRPGLSRQNGKTSIISVRRISKRCWRERHWEHSRSHKCYKQHPSVSHSGKTQSWQSGSSLPSATAAQHPSSVSLSPNSWQISSIPPLLEPPLSTGLSLSSVSPPSTV